MIGLFLRSLFSHTFSYVGVALLLVGVYAKISNRVLLVAPKWFLLAGVAFLAVGGSQAWKDEHKNTEILILQRRQAEIAINDLQAKLDASQRQLEYLKTHLSDDSDRKARERVVIERLMEDGNHLMEECLLKKRNDADIADRANRWEAQATQELAAFDPSLAARLKTTVGTPYVHPPTNGANDEVWNFVNQRVQALATILQDLKG